MKILLLLSTFVFVLLNAFFVASEFALVKIRPTRLEELIKQGDSRAKLALRMTQHLDAYLSANQLGITLASLALGWVGEPAFAGVAQEGLTALGVESPVTAHAIGFAFAFALITTLHTVLGELAPKTLAIQRTEKVTLWTARPLHVFYIVMWPIIRVLNGAANAFVRLLGLRPYREDEFAHTSEELRMLLTANPAGLDPNLRSMLVRIFDLRRRTARHVMSLRSDAMTLRGSMTIEEAAQAVADAGYSRYPVLDAAGKRVLGYVHVRDLFLVLVGRRRASRLAELLREPIVAKADTSVERLRSQMQSLQRPVAIVLNDESEFVGLVTMEDLLEEIVGEIRDEHDEEVAPVLARDKGLWEVDGRVLLSDLERDEGIVLRPEHAEAETIAAYFLGRLGRPPNTGERVECDGYVLTAMDVAGRRLRRARIVELPRAEA